MSIIDKARSLRLTIENLSQTLNDEQALQSIELFPTWKIGVEYTTGTKVKYDGVLYKVLQDHVSQEDWNPSISPSLFAKVLIPDENVIPVWEQPDSTNAYKIGDRVYYPTAEDNIYQSTIDNNVWSPVDYPAGWTLIS